MDISTLDQIDTSDLDLLDDEAAHALCTFCHPEDVSLKPVIVLCGVTAIIRAQGKDPLLVPPNACEACLEAFDLPCRRCGH